MARKEVCEAPVCKSTKTARICPVLVPIWGGKGCRERRKNEFHPDSFFQKKSGKAFVTIGCLKGDWDARAGRCKRGTRAYQIRIPR